MDNNLLKSVKFTRVKNAVVAGTSQVDSDIVDMQGFDGVLFVLLLGTVTDASVLTLLAQGNSVNSSSGMAAIAGATTGAITAATNSNQVLLVDVYRPALQYVRAVLTRTTQNAVVDGLLAIQYKARKKPTVQDVTTILASALAAF